MIGLAELLLFAAPFAAFAAWRVLGPRVTPALLAASIGALALLAGTAAWFVAAGRMGPHEAYVPAHVEAGVLVPGHGAPGPR